MKRFITGLLEGRKTRWGMLAALLAAAGLSLAWMETPQYQLGGAWIGSGGAGIWNALQIPLDQRANCSPPGQLAHLQPPIC